MLLVGQEPALRLDGFWHCSCPVVFHRLEFSLVQQGSQALNVTTEASWPSVAEEWALFPLVTADSRVFQERNRSVRATVDSRSSALLFVTLLCSASLTWHFRQTSSRKYTLITS